MKRAVCIIIAAALLLCACGERPEETAVSKMTAELSDADFAEGNHKRSEEYMAAFRTRFAVCEGVSIIFAENVYDAEKSPALAEGMAESYYCLRSCAPEMAAELEVYVVSITTTGGPVLLDGRLYITDSMVESGDYIPWLTSCVYGIDDYWRCLGLGSYAAGDNAGEDELGREIEAYFAANPDSYILSLHPCFFLEEFADETTRALAEKMALSLTEYIISGNSAAVFLEDGGETYYKKAWLESLGLECDLSYLESKVAGRLEAMNFSTTKDIPMILSERDFRLNMSSVDWLSDAETAYGFLLELCDGAEKLYSRFEAEAPVFYSCLLENADATAVQFRPGDYPISSRASMLKAEAVVTDDADVLHEICHTLMPRAAIDEAYWLCEGLVTYLTAPYVSYRADSIVVDSVLMEYEGDTEEDRALRAETVRCFEQLNGCEITEVYDMEQPIYKMYEATGYAAFLNPDNNSAPVATQSIKDNYSERHGNSIKGNYPGNELSYLESMLFTQWLVDKYGLETVIAAQMYKESYFELFPSADAFEAEFAEFWTARVEPLAK